MNILALDSQTEGVDQILSRGTNRFALFRQLHEECYCSSEPVCCEKEMSYLFQNSFLFFFLMLRGFYYFTLAVLRMLCCQSKCKFQPYINTRVDICV